MTTLHHTSMEDVVKEFSKHTGNDALRTIVCVCCAIEVEESKMWNVSLDSIPNNELLVPTCTHPKHKIIQLLSENGVPLKIQTTARYSTDMESVICEYEGYVLSNNNEISEIPSDAMQEETRDWFFHLFIPIAINK